MKVGASLASNEAEVHRFASNIYRVRKRSKGPEPNLKATINRAKAMEGKKREMERAKARRLQDSLGGSER